MRWAAKMCIFNGTFALWVSGRVGEEACSDQILIVSTEFDRYGSVCKRWDKIVLVWSRLRGEEGEAPLGWILPVWLHGWLTGWGWILHGAVLKGAGDWWRWEWAPPPVCQLLSMSLLVSLSISFEDYIQKYKQFFIHVKTIYPTKTKNT